MTTHRRTPIEKQRDLVDIASRYLAGHSQQEIADWLTANRPYRIWRQGVTKDLEEIRVIWRNRAAQLIGERKAEELAKLDRLEREAWEGWERSRSDAVRKHAKRTGKGADATEEVGTSTEHRDGNPKFLELVLRCVEKRLEVLGLASHRVQLSGPGGGPIQVQATASVYDKLDTDTILELNRVLRASGAFEGADAPDSGGGGGDSPTSGRALSA